MSKATTGPKVKCNNCDQVIQSMHRNDFVSCRCRLRSNSMITKIHEEIIAVLELPEFLHHKVACALSKHLGTGIAVDGGDEYLHMCYSERTTYKVLVDKDAK